MEKKCDIVFYKVRDYKDRDMKAKYILSLLMLGIILTMTACQKGDVTENFKVDKEQDFIPTCEIIESSDATCEKAVKTGIYTDYSSWEKAIKDTDVEVVLDKKDTYDENFFENKALVYLVDCSSGNAQCEYEDYVVEEIDGENILQIKVSYSTELLLNKLHAYHVFFVMDKVMAEKLDEAKLSLNVRDSELTEEKDDISTIEPEMEKALSVLDYQNICKEMMETNSAYGSDYEKMAVHMAKIMNRSQQITLGKSYRLVDMDDKSRKYLASSIAYYEYNCEPVYGLNNLIDDINHNESGLAAIYNKDEFRNILASFYEGGELSGVETILVDLGDNIGVQAADGDSWHYFDAYDIKENDDYVLIHAACYYSHNGGAENVYEYTANMLFEKASDSIFGLRLVYVEGYNNDLTKYIVSITASSELPNQADKTYSVNNLIDKNDETAWVENANGVGVGEKIMIQLNEKQMIQEIGIRNGYQAFEEIFDKNGYVTKWSVQLGDEVVKEATQEFDYFYFGEKNLSKISFDKPIYTDTITITILDAKAGSKYSDTCISEIEIH